VTAALRQRTRHRWLVLGGGLAALMAVWAWAGAVGVAVGGIDFGAEITARLPWQSTSLAAAALAVGVAVPMTAAAVLVARRSPAAPTALLAAGLLLAGWIVVQLLFIRTFSWLQPVCFAYGLVVARLATTAARRR
jgi:hypothetical protein